MCRDDILHEAWRRVRRNKGAAGVDRVTIEEVEQHGVERFLGEIGEGLRAGEYGACLLYHSDAADERSSGDPGGRRLIKKKKT